MYDLRLSSDSYLLGSIFGPREPALRVRRLKRRSCDAAGSYSMHGKLDSCKLGSFDSLTTKIHLKLCENPPHTSLTSKVQLISSFMDIYGCFRRNNCTFDLSTIRISPNCRNKCIFVLTAIRNYHFAAWLLAGYVILRLCGLAVWLLGGLGALRLCGFAALLFGLFN